MRPAIQSLLLAAVFAVSSPVLAQENPCGGRAKNPCNPCAKNPCNPCAKSAGNPCAKNPCGKAHRLPAVNPCYRKLGRVFYVVDPMHRNSVSFTSSAPLEDFAGTSNQVRGYIVFDPARPDRGVRGEFSVPVASIDTGIPLRNEHLQSASWLDAAKHPLIRLRIDGTRRVRLLKQGRGYRTWEMDLTAVMTLHGRSKLMDLTTRVTFLPESEKTRKRLPGDLLAGRAEFEVPLRDFGVTGFEGVLGNKVSERIAVKVGVMGSSAGMSAANPENPCAKNPCNPCNPRAKRTKNPCNPCAKGMKNACNPCSKGR